MVEIPPVVSLGTVGQQRTRFRKIGGGFRLREKSGRTNETSAPLNADGFEAIEPFSSKLNANMANHGRLGLAQRSTRSTPFRVPVVYRFSFPTTAILPQFVRLFAKACKCTRTV